MPKTRFTAEERKKQIIENLIPLFTSRGFASVTSKDMAQAAEVSEALIFKYFPNKKDIYASVQDHIAKDMEQEIAALCALQPSFQSFSMFLSKFLHVCILEPDQLNKMFSTLMMRSIIEDGEFAREFIAKKMTFVAPFVEACLKECKKEERLSESHTPEKLGLWFVDHICIMIYLNTRGEIPTVEYGYSRKNLSAEVANFCLRGLGFNKDSIDKFYDIHNQYLLKEVKRA